MAAGAGLGMGLGWQCMVVVGVALGVRVRLLWAGPPFYDDPFVHRSPVVSGTAPLSAAFHTNFWGEPLHPSPGPDVRDTARGGGGGGDRGATGSSSTSVTWPDELPGEPPPPPPPQPHAQQQPQHHSYRPVVVLVWRAWVALLGLSQRSFRLLNLALHGVNSGLVFTLLSGVAARQRQLSEPDRTRRSVSPLPTVALSAALLFAVHPVLTEAIAAAVGSAELISALFTLCALLATARGGDGDSWGWFVLASAWALLALLAKETGITALPLCAVYDWMLVARFDLVSALRGAAALQPCWAFARRFLCLVAMAVAQLAFRLWVCSEDEGDSDLTSNPSRHILDPLSRTLTRLHYSAVHLSLLCWPTRLSFDYSGFSIPIVASLSDPRNLGTLAMLVGVALVAVCAIQQPVPDTARRWRPAARLVIVGWTLATVSFLPCTHFGPAVAYVVAERLLYLPSVGACLALAATLHTALPPGRQSRRAFALACVGVLQVLVVASVNQNVVWQSPWRATSSSVASYPRNTRLWMHRADALSPWDELLQLKLDCLERAGEAAPFHNEVAGLRATLLVLHGRRHDAIALLNTTEHAVAFPAPGWPFQPLREYRVGKVLCASVKMLVLSARYERAADTVAKMLRPPVPPEDNAAFWAELAQHLRELAQSPPSRRLEELTHATFHRIAAIAA